MGAIESLREICLRNGVRISHRAEWSWFSHTLAFYFGWAFAWCNPPRIWFFSLQNFIPHTFRFFIHCPVSGSLLGQHTRDLVFLDKESIKFSPCSSRALNTIWWSMPWAASLQPVNHFDFVSLFLFFAVSSLHPYLGHVRSAGVPY